MTSFGTVYEAFLSKILDDEWDHMIEEEIDRDLGQLLEGAIPWFKFPKKSLAREDTYFLEELSPQEIQILATYMKCEWLNRSIMTWENIKPLYDERDFSQANFLDRLTKSLELEKREARRLESLYYRTNDHRPFNYQKMAGR